jgi:E3 ubiquitin-protein ligase HUWE1
LNSCEFWYGFQSGVPEILCRSKIAIKMNRPSDRVKGSEEAKDEMDQESLPDDDEMEGGQDAAREETPDLYRNSSLGM